MSNKIDKRKLTILQVGYGWPPRQIGGAIFYTKSLCEALVKAGHNVTYFYTGDQNPLPFSYLSHKKEGQLNLIELVNSPNFYHTQYNNPDSELSNKVIEEKFREVLKTVQPDVVHFQNFPGICASLAKIAKDSGAVVLNSMHNYMPICPVGELFDYQRNAICDLDHCSKCYDSRSSRKYMRKLYVYIAGFLSKEMKNKLAKYVESSTKILVDKKEAPDSEKNGAAKRRRLLAFGKALNYIDINLAVSERVKDIYLRYLKLKPAKVIVNHVGSEEPDEKTVQHKTSREKIKFVFLGSLSSHKGFQILLEAYKQLDQTKFQLYVYAPISKDYHEAQGEIEKNFSIKFMGGYAPKDLPKILKQCDVGIVPPIWHDNAPRVVFEMQTAKLPVIASNVGGMSDFIDDGKNGFIYQYDDPSQLASKMENFVEDPRLVGKFSKNIRPIKNIHKHLKEIETIYYELLDL